MFRYKKQKKKCCVWLEGELTIYNALELKTKLDELVNDPRELEIDLAGVTEIDTAGIQLLMLAKRERDRHGWHFALTSHSDPVVDAFELTGMFGYFSDPVVLTDKQGDCRGS